MSKNAAPEEILGLLHAKLADVLTQRLKDKDVDSAIINAARQFLKDNGIEAGSDVSQFDTLNELVSGLEKDTESEVSEYGPN